MMSKKPFVPQREKPKETRVVRVAIKPANVLPEREPKSWVVMIGVPALVIGLLGTIVMLYVSGARSLSNGMFPLVGMGGMAMLMFSGRFGNARKISFGENEKNRRTYLRDLDVDREEIQKAVCEQRNAQRRAHSTPLGLGTVIGSKRMWERSPSDDDFLDVRLGVGSQHAPDSVISMQMPDVSVEDLEPVSGMALRDFILEQRKIRDIAKVLSLRSQPGFSFIGEPDPVRSLLRSILCSVAVFHNPRDVKVIVVTRNPEAWSWIAWMPHNQHDELFDACGFRRLVFSTPSELEETLGAELLRASGGNPWSPPQLASPTSMGSALESGGTAKARSPHWIVVDDNTGSSEAWEGVIGQKGKAGMTLLRVASRVGVGVGFSPDQVYELCDSDQNDEEVVAS